jgi:4-amino-4-deoxy-L-arabinose transferase-like glycosyltransferase
VRLIVTVLVAAVVLAPLLLLGESSALLGVVALAAFLVLSAAILLTQGQAATSGMDETARERRFLATLILAGFTARIVVAAVLRQAGLNEFFAPDEDTFHRNGLQFSLWLGGDSPYRLSWRFHDSLQVGYYYLVGAIYYLFGSEPLLPILLNCVIGAVTALPVYKIARQLGGREAARPAAILVAFFPSLLLWSTLLIRDSLVILVLMLVIASVMDLRRGFTFHRLVLLLVLLMALGTLRQYLFLMVAAAAVMSFLVGRTGRTGRSVLVGALAIVALLAMVKLAGFGVWEMERASLHHLNLHRQYNALETASGTIAPQVDISEPANALLYLPVGIVYFLLSPFPWQVLTPRQVLSVPDVLLWYALLPPILLGLAAAVRHRFRDASMLLLSVAVITILYALVEGNVGIIFRHRAQVIAPMMVLAGMGIAARRARKTDAAAVPAPAGASG